MQLLGEYEYFFSPVYFYHNTLLKQICNFFPKTTLNIDRYMSLLCINNKKTVTILVIRDYSFANRVREIIYYFT